MSDDSILAELERKALEAEASASKYRAAIAVLLDSGSAKPTASVNRDSVALRRLRERRDHGIRRTGPSTTMSMIRTVISGSLKPLSPTDLTAKMLESGWETESENPVNTVRTALFRLHERGDLSRNEAGEYYVSALAAITRILGTENDDTPDARD